MTAGVLDGSIRQLGDRVRQWLGPPPSYGPDTADLRTFSVGGLELPVRATVAVLLVVVAICLDWSRTFIPQPILDLGRAAPAMRYQATERLLLFGALPLLVLLAAFRDRPGRYGLGLGAWRIGLPVALAGIGVMSPIILALAARPEFAAYYAPSHAPVGDVLFTSLLDLPASEFLIRGFLMFALLRVVGPVAVVLVTLPFVFSHLGKPEIELLSTFFGGLAYGWLDWRTGSIWWSAATHVVLVTLLVSAVPAG
ncbi:MAG TPA: CPBP family intramembrane glutamic endopeptidase [Candidatus Limnocylindrales bacterium]|nr:CPBP family intramembrane glutamic endopeptidase [Candidatus Limnocylindrales bacterium]